MTKRNLSYESELYEIEESGILNALYLLFLLKHLKKCSLNALACGMYLFRFLNLTIHLLEEAEREKFIQFIPEWELENLDSLLMPYILQKYDKRFINGLKELYVRALIEIENNTVMLKENEKTGLFEIEKFELINHKAFHISEIIKRTSYEELVKKIETIVGEEQWKTIYS